MDSELGRAVDSMAALVAFVTPTAEIEYFNREFLDYTGRTLEDAHGPLLRLRRRDHALVLRHG